MKIADTSSLKAHIHALFEENTRAAMYQKALQEKEKQQASTRSVPLEKKKTQKDDGDNGDTDLFDDEAQDSDTNSSKTLDADREALAQGDVGPRDIVDKLNSIRSGKSFKDDNVRSAMEEYVGSLNKTERVALLAFLKGIAQIVTGEIEAQHAIEPESDPANVKMDRPGGDKGTKKIQATVVKSSSKKNDGHPPAEDTSGPMPITPKRK